MRRRIVSLIEMVVGELDDILHSLVDVFSVMML